MLREQDLPCSDCGAELVERSVEAQELSVSAATDGSIRVAECPLCGARYVPERSLTDLTAERGGDQIEGGG